MMGGDINLFGIGQKAAKDESFEGVNMDKENVTGVNLFGIGGDGPSGKKNDATDENLEQPQRSDTGNDPIDDASADADDTPIATPVTAASGNSGTSGPLPTPPKPNPGEKVDTSKLDAELAKMKSSGSPNAQTPSLSAPSTGVPPPKQHTNDASDGGTDEDTDEDWDAVADASDDASDGDTDASGKNGQPDPAFAEKVTGDVHADENAPQTTSISTEPVQSLTAQSVNYQQPNISELKKHPTPEKKTDGYGSVPIEKMSVTLTFETGRQKITFGELEKVKTGYTFECGNPVNAPVTICANDTPIGTGELLDVDGRIGVRIIEFYNK
jgi:flagellar motor switch/type III secretory pathway protein FliN